VRLLLQINARGSWSNVVEFDGSREGAIRVAVLPLATVLAAGDRELCKASTSFRIVKAGGGRSPKVVSHLDDVGLGWRRA